MKKVVRMVLSFVLVLSVGLLPIGKRGFSVPEKLATVSVFSSPSGAHFAQEPVEKISRAHSAWLLFSAWLMASCVVAPTKDKIHQLTTEIRSSIRAGETGNSYRIVDWVEERKALMDEGDFQREDLIGKDGLDLKGIAKQIYLEFGITVEGASEAILLQMLDLLRILPAEHVKIFHGFVFNVDYNSFYDHDAGGRYYPFNPGIASLKKGGDQSEQTIKRMLTHEVGHGVQLEGIPFLKSLSYWWMHFALSGDPKGFASPYAQKNNWEDFAETYESWVYNTIESIDKFRRNKKKKIVFEKFLFVAKQFVFKKEEKFYLRVYDLLTYEDILLDINGPEDLNLSHLSKLKKKTTLGKIPFAFAKENVVQLKYEDFHFIVPQIISMPDTLYGTDLFCLILEKIKNDPFLSHRKKQEQAQDLIYRILFGLFSERSLPYRKSILRGIQSQQLNAKKDLFVIEPEWMQTSYELEAFFFFEPVGFRDWLVQDIDAALEKISSLFSESMSASQYKTFLSRISLLEKKNWDEKEMAFESASAFEREILVEIIVRKAPEVLKNIIEQNKTLNTALITPNQYKLMEKLFNGDKEKTYESIFPGQGESRIEKSYDLIEMILDTTADWEKLRAEKNFQPYLKKLQERFSGITIEEILGIITFIKKREDDLTEEKIFALFLLLNEEVENFVKLYPEWFLNRSKNQKLMNPFFKLIALNKVSPKHVQLFCRRLLALQLAPLWKEALCKAKVHPEVESLIPAMEKSLLQKGFSQERLHNWKEKILKEPDTKQSKLNNEESLLNSSL